MSESFFEDDSKLDYPTADRMVEKYVEKHASRPRTTSVDVLDWSDYPNDHHNRQRVYDALTHLCIETEANWAGRTVFQIPAELTNDD